LLDCLLGKCELSIDLSGGYSGGKMYIGVDLTDISHKIDIGIALIGSLG
jgi:hypothetical protein